MQKAAVLQKLEDNDDHKMIDLGTRCQLHHLRYISTAEDPGKYRGQKLDRNYSSCFDDSTSYNRRTTDGLGLLML